MDPTSTPLSWYSGFAFFKQNNLSEAREKFLDAYKLNPYHIHVLNNLASTYAMSGTSDSAIFFYEKAVKIAPNFDESWFNMSAVYFNMKEYTLAYESLKRVNLFTTDKRYRPFVKTIVRTLLVQELENSFYSATYTLPEDEQWYFEVHKMLRNEHKSLKNIIFEQQILSPKQ
jgi:tetratricopeptide (TPR) repeat protein